MFAEFLPDQRTETELKPIKLSADLGGIFFLVSSLQRGQPHYRATPLPLVRDSMSCWRTLAQAGYLPARRFECLSPGWRTTALTARPPCGSNHSTGNWDYQGLTTLLTEQGYRRRVDWPSFKICAGTELQGDVHTNKHQTDEKPGTGGTGRSAAPIC